MSYRAPPAVLPSLRDVDAENEAMGRYYAGPKSFESYQRLSAREPFAFGELREERRARERAEAAPLPAFTVDPSATLPPRNKIFAYVRPPPIPHLPGPGQSVRE